MKTNKTIYTNRRDNRQYVLEPQLMQGNKVCLIDMKTGEHKFTAESTLKRWYSKTVIPAAEFVTVSAFTGMKIGVFQANLVEGLIEVFTKKGNLLKFDPDTGVQTNARNPKFANRITWAV